MMLLPLFLVLAQIGSPVPPAEEPVAPYVQSDANIGTSIFTTTDMAEAFHGQEGIRRIANGWVDRNIADPRISDIFKGQDMVRLRRTLFEHVCAILAAGCTYTGRDMKGAHKNLGIQQADFNALTENLQAAMRAEHVSFAAQNRLLAKVAPMHRDIIER